jgi:hypothetical protein
MFFSKVLVLQDLYVSTPDTRLQQKITCMAHTRGMILEHTLADFNASTRCESQQHPSKQSTIPSEEIAAATEAEGCCSLQDTDIRRCIKVWISTAQSNAIAQCSPENSMVPWEITL